MKTLSQKLIAPILAAFFALALGVIAEATEFKQPIKTRDDYQHDRFLTEPREIVWEFDAYLTSFDWMEDDGQAWGIPDFVAYEIKRLTSPLEKAPDRPSPWISDPDLVKQNLAPTDATYHHSKAFLAGHPDWYVRGHLAMKDHAWRLGANADWNTHTVLNAVPQRGSFNGGIWLTLENKTADWADEFGAVWIVAGPVINGTKPKLFLGEASKREMLIAIPDALFKIVVKDSKENPSVPDVLAFRFPQSHPKYKVKPYDLAHFLVSVRDIEKATRLDFFTSLPKDVQDKIETQKATKLWGQN